MTRIHRKLLSVVCLLVATVVEAKDPAFTIVLDPGHGGKDSGCVGVTAKEKDIVLDVATLLRDKIDKEYGGKVEVVMTRDTDRYITLQQRADIANRAHGDLFVSIHVNSVDRGSKNRTQVSGAQVYTCGLHRSSDNLQVAMRENSVIELEGNDRMAYHGFDPKSSESYIMFELSQSVYQQSSLMFASLCQNMLTTRAGRANKGVLQAGFWVLWSTAMPSVLVELDFICNPTQEAFLSSDAGQEKCADALFQAFKKYYDNKTKNK